MGKNKRNGSMREQMEGIAIAIAPITSKKKRYKKQDGGEIDSQMSEILPEDPNETYSDAEIPEATHTMPDGTRTKRNA
jgi:hypothetical protein